jgi:hypothetical protein
MAAHLLVLAQRTAASPELIEALRARKERGPIHATLVMPAAGPGAGERAATKERLDAALAAWREAGIPSDGVVGDPVPLNAFAEHWDPLRHDEPVVSTLPGQSSRWLRSDLPNCVARHAGVPVQHVVARDPEAVPEAAPAPEHERAALGPLSVLAWGGKRS